MGVDEEKVRQNMDILFRDLVYLMPKVAAEREK
jgi:5-methylthioadenosine/S-adenosylhomocysteine deaminase